MITGEFFVTPHAVRQFQERIVSGLALSFDEARAVILKTLPTAGPLRQTTNGKAYYCRVRGVVNYRAVIGPGEGDRPAVITILRSGR